MSMSVVYGNYPKRIIWETPSGEIRVTIPVMPPRDGEPEELYLDRVAMHALTSPKLLGAKRLANIHESELPLCGVCGGKAKSCEACVGSGKRFRTCWRAAAGKLVVDVALARTEVLARVRQRRNILLAQSDSDKHRLDDIGTPNQRQAIAAYRQALRDMPSTIMSALEAISDAAELERFTAPFPEKPK